MPNELTVYEHLLRMFLNDIHDGRKPPACIRLNVRDYHQLAVALGQGPAVPHVALYGCEITPGPGVDAHQMRVLRDPEHGGWVTRRIGKRPQPQRRTRVTENPK